MFNALRQKIHKFWSYIQSLIIQGYHIQLHKIDTLLFILILIFNFYLIQINGTKVDGLGFVAARQHLDAARPVARLLVERRPRLAESKYAMAQQTNSEVLSPSQSLDIPDKDITGSSDDDGYENDDKSEKREPDDEDEESQVGFTSVTPLQIKLLLLLTGYFVFFICLYRVNSLTWSLTKAHVDSASVW